MTDKQLSPYLECGRIINTHGVRGGLKAEPWSDTPKDICRLSRIFIGKGTDKKEYRITRASVMQGKFLLFELEGIGDMDAANALRGETIFALREDIPLKAGQFFLADTVGLPVVDTRPGREGQQLGRVREVIDGAASPVFVIDTPAGQVMVPGVPAFIKGVEPGERVLLEPIDGMFENRDTEEFPGDGEV